MEKRVYLDHGATTMVDPLVVEEMLPFFTQRYGNPSSLHEFGTEAKNALDKARERVMRLINAGLEKELVFTSGGTEADNIAIQGAAFGNMSKGKHIITSVIEHPAVKNTCKHLEKNGFEVTWLPVDQHGLIDMYELAEAIREDTTLISLMFANNEIGTVQDIFAIGALARERGVLFHTDAVQAVGKVEIDVNKLNIDLLSLSAHKMHGPKGIGALYVRKDTKLKPIIFGGGHEWGLRSSTENVPGIVGLGKAADLCRMEMPEETPRLVGLRDRLIRGVLGSGMDEVYLNGHPEKRLPNNAHFRFSYIEGEGLLLLLDAKGIAASTGSACSSTSLEPSAVLTAIGLRHDLAHGSLRCTLGRFTTQDEIDHVIKELPPIVQKLRDMSPVGKGREWFGADDDENDHDHHHELDDEDNNLARE